MLVSVRGAQRGTKGCKETLMNAKGFASKIIFSEKSLSVHMSVCLSVCPVPSRTRKKVAETENFAKQSCQISFPPIRPGGGGVPFCPTLEYIVCQLFLDGRFNIKTWWFFTLKVFTLPTKIKKKKLCYQIFLEILIFQKFCIKNWVIRKKSFKIIAPTGNRTQAAGLVGEHATFVLETSNLTIYENVQDL